VNSKAISEFRADEVELLHCLVAAPTHKVAAEWVGHSHTHFRRRLSDLRDRTGVETNYQLIVLASVSGALDVQKVLPYHPSAD
jgi:hypothetical protein